MPGSWTSTIATRGRHHASLRCRVGFGPQGPWPLSKRQVAREEIEHVCEFHGIDVKDPFAILPSVLQQALTGCEQAEDFWQSFAASGPSKPQDSEKLSPCHGPTVPGRGHLWEGLPGLRGLSSRGPPRLRHHQTCARMKESANLARFTQVCADTCMAAGTTCLFPDDTSLK